MEKEEVVKLVEKARAGDELAFETLFLSYEDLISGQKMTRKFKTFGANNEDFKSLCKLLFVEAIHSYDHTKSKLSTYITNYIHWNYMDRAFKERLVSISRHRINKDSKEVNLKRIEDTTAIPEDDAFFRTYFNKSVVWELRFLTTGESFVINSDNIGPTLVGVYKSKYPRSHHIFESYVNHRINNDLPNSRALQNAAKECGISPLAVKRVVKSAFNHIQNTVSITEAELSHSAKKRTTNVD